jgi:hypothetical protein
VVTTSTKLSTTWNSRGQENWSSADCWVSITAVTAMNANGTTKTTADTTIAIALNP